MLLQTPLHLHKLERPVVSSEAFKSFTNPTLSLAILILLSAILLISVFQEILNDTKINWAFDCAGGSQWNHSSEGEMTTEPRTTSVHFTQSSSVAISATDHQV